MEGSLRLTVAVLFAGVVAGCTMIGAPERSAPAATAASSAADPVPNARRRPTAAAAARRPEPPSRGGNMSEYRQSGGTYRVLESSAGYDERGIASWYGEQFHGRPTSNGERFDMHAPSAAHRTLPLPSWVEVTNLANGRTIVVRVNDRGPFHDPGRRIIDLSYAAAVELGMVGTGTAPVRVRAVEPYQRRR